MTDKILTKDEIFGADDLKREKVDVPEWNGSVWVRALSGRERDKLETSIIGEDGKRRYDNLRAKLVVLSVVDEEGNRLFAFEDADEVGKKSARAIDRIFTVAQKLSGITPDDVEAMTKNSEPIQGDDSISD